MESAYSILARERRPRPRLDVRRGGVTDFIDRHQTVWEVACTILALGYLAVTVYDDEGRGIAPDWLILTFTGVFLAEFAVRFVDAPSRLGYVRHHWLDLVSCVPFVGGLRAFRLVRLLRAGALIRLLLVIEHAEEAHGKRRDSLWFLMPALTTLWIVASYGIWLFEHGINPSIHDFGDALYWAFITITTVGYGDVSPVTPEGRILAGFLIFFGLGLLGVVSSRLTAAWLHHGGENHELAKEVAALRVELATLRETLATPR